MTDSTGNINSNTIKDNIIFFLCSSCGNVPIIRFSSSEPFTLGFLCNFCNKRNYYTLEAFYNKLSKEEIGEYVQYIEPNIDIIKDNNKCILHERKEKDNYCFQCKEVFCYECKNKHLHHNWINIHNISLSDKRISKIAYNIQIAINFINESFKPITKGVFSMIASNNNKNEMILYFISILLSNYDLCKNYQVIDNLFYFFSSINLTVSNPLIQPELMKENKDSLRMIQCVKEIKTNNSIKYLLLLQDKKRLLVCSHSKDMEVYNVDTFSCIMLIKGHSNGVNYASYFDNKDGIITSSNENTIKIWKISKSSYKLIASISNDNYVPNQVLRFCDDKIISSNLTGVGIFNIWTIPTFKKIKLPKSNKYTDCYGSASLSIVSHNSSVYILILEHEKTSFIKLDKDLNCDLILAIKDFAFDGEAVLIENKDKIFICGYEAIYIYNTISGQCETTIEGSFNFEGVIKSYTVLESGNILLGTAKYMYLFDAVKGEIIKKEEIHFGYVESIAKISKNIIATCSNDQRIKIWKY